MSFKNLKKSLKYRASSLSNALVLNIPDLSKTKSKWRDICSPTVEARCISLQNAKSHSSQQRKSIQLCPMQQVIWYSRTQLSDLNNTWLDIPQQLTKFVFFCDLLATTMSNIESPCSIDHFYFSWIKFWVTHSQRHLQCPTKLPSSERWMLLSYIDSHIL